MIAGSLPLSLGDFIDRSIARLLGRSVGSVARSIALSLGHYIARSIARSIGRSFDWSIDSLVDGQPQEKQRLILNITKDFDARYLSGKALRVLFQAGPDDLSIQNLILLPNAPTCFLTSYGAGVDPFWDLKKEGADIFEIVFIGPGSATILILAVSVIPGDARQEA